MRSLARTIILPAALAASLLAVSAGTAVASAPKPPVVSAATHPVVVYEPTLAGPHPVKDVVRPSSCFNFGEWQASCQG